MTRAAAHLALLASGALVAAPVAAARIEFKPAEVAICEAQGGCQVVTTLSMLKMAREAFDAGRKSCNSRSDA